MKKSVPCQDCICLAMCVSKTMDEVKGCEKVFQYLSKPFGSGMCSAGDWDALCDFLNNPQNKIIQDPNEVILRP